MKLYKSDGSFGWMFFAESEEDLYNHVIHAAAIAMGIDVAPLWKAVHEANMTKADGPVINGKKCKPAGFVPPDIAGLLRKQGWTE